MNWSRLRRQWIEDGGARLTQKSTMRPLEEEIFFSLSRNVTQPTGCRGKRRRGGGNVEIEALWRSPTMDSVGWTLKLGLQVPSIQARGGYWAAWRKRSFLQALRTRDAMGTGLVRQILASRVGSPPMPPMTAMPPMTGPRTTRGRQAGKQVYDNSISSKQGMNEMQVDLDPLCAHSHTVYIHTCMHSCNYIVLN